MNVSKKKVRNNWVVSIGGDLTIYHINECWQKLKVVLGESNGPVKLNLAKVEEVDTAGLQLIMYLQKYYSDQITGFEKLSDSIKKSLEFTDIKLV